MASKRSVSDFVRVMRGLSTPPVSFMLLRDMGEEEAQCACIPSDDLATVALEEAIQEELAVLSGEVTFRIVALAAGGAVIRRTLLTYHGRAPKEAAPKMPFDVNRELVAMVAESNRQTLIHAKELFSMSQAAHRETREALSSTQSLVGELAVALSGKDAPAPVDGNHTVITQRLDSLIGMGAKFLGGKMFDGGGQPTTPTKPGIAGRHDNVREFLSSLTDDEIDRIKDVLLKSGVGESLIDCLGVTSRGRLLGLFETEGSSAL